MTKQRAEPDLEDIIYGAIDDYSYIINCHRVGEIQSFDPLMQTATVKLADKNTFSTDQGDVLVDFPLLVNCPVIVNKAVKGGVTIPINAGDTCLVHFNDRDLDNWLIDGLTQRTNTSRAHDLSDGIVEVGVRNQINNITDYNNVATELNYENNKISLDSNKISLLNSSGGSIIIDDKLELKNSAENLKGLIDELITIVTNLKTVDPISGPLPIDGATSSALSALSTRVGDLLK
jgi:hypothetical protein